MLNKSQLFATILAQAPQLKALGEQLFNTPELGFKEYRTREILLQEFAKLPNFTIQENLALTGFSAELINPQATQTLALIAELDAVYQPGHFAAAHDGAAHCCGHDSQMVIMLAVAQALCHQRLPFNLRIIFTPAEEFLDLDYRQQLQAAGKIHHLSGKQEMIRLGVFDNVSAAIAVHSMGQSADYDFDLNTTLVGFIIKRATFHGKSAHAGAAPEQGINALNAASLALSAIAYIRETFPDHDHIRVSPVIKPANWAANVIPDQAQLEMYIRAASIEAMQITAAKIDNCLQGAALAIGCRLEINNIPGYLPLKQDQSLTELAHKNALDLTTAARISADSKIVAASGDIGDLSLLMPTIQIGYGGYQGTIHGGDFAIMDAEKIYVKTAQLVSGIVCDLANNPAQLTELSAAYPKIDVQQYQKILGDLS